MGRFSAVYTGSGEVVDGLTAADCGETLLGVPCEVHERSAFIRQSSSRSMRCRTRAALDLIVFVLGILNRRAKRPPRSKSSSTPANTTSPAAFPRSRPRSAHRSARSRNCRSSRAASARPRKPSPHSMPRKPRCANSSAHTISAIRRTPAAPPRKCSRHGRAPKAKPNIFAVR